MSASAAPALAAHASDATPPRARLRDLIAAKSLRTGSFRLASGRASSFLFDLKPTLLDPAGAALVGDALLDLIEGDEAGYVGGLEMGGVLLVMAMCARGEGRRPRGFFFVRKQAKEHGTQNRIDGNLKAGAVAPGARAIIVEDVTTTGGSALQAVAAARAAGCTVDTVITVIDRLEGAEEALHAEGLRLVALFTRGDFPEIDAADAVT